MQLVQGKGICMSAPTNVGMQSIICFDEIVACLDMTKSILMVPFEFVGINEINPSNKNGLFFYHWLTSETCSPMRGFCHTPFLSP